jgi:hypothetical protein
MVIDNRLTVLDFYCYHADSCWSDVANMVTYLQLQRHSRRLRGDVIERWLRAFQIGFIDRYPIDQPAFHAQLLLHWLCRLQDLVATEPRGWRAQWSHRAMMRGAMDEWQQALDVARRL